jgi:putative glutamine amidotransferase
MKPRIAIPQPHSTNAAFVAKSFPQYRQAIEWAGGEAVEIGMGFANPEIMRVAMTCDGVLLPGSPADINPEKYGVPRDPRTAPADPARDNADELLLQDAFNLRKPLLGVCFGLQALNVWRTGTLVQHLTTPVEHSGKSVPDPHHRIRVVADSRLGSILTETVAMPGSRPAHVELIVNSSHHQAAAVVGDGLRPVAWCCDDGVIEAVEGVWPAHWVIAVQWHPERMTEDLAAQALFRAFVDAAQSFHANARAATPDFESLRR